MKALTKALMTRPEPIPTLYIKTLAQRAYGPQMSVRQIFTKARQTAPCLLLFEDVDSLVTDQVRSYFLNEVDGLEDNDGILMIGSTNNCRFHYIDVGVKRMRADRDSGQA
jgi:transitional endoplasmic reticulum ATPase